MNKDDIFYVYCMLDPRKPGNFIYGRYQFNFEPFYIGKGKGYRSKHHLCPSHLEPPCRKNSKLKKLTLLGLSPLIMKIKQNLTENEAFSVEKELIKTIGRIDDGTGPLTNMSEGGEGPSGLIQSTETRLKRSMSLKGKIPWNKGVKYSEETRKTMSQTSIAYGCGKSNKGRKLTKEHKTNISKGSMGRVHSQETRLKIGLGNKGKIVSEEARKRMSQGQKRRTTGRVISEETKRKMSMAKKLNPPIFSDETRNKLSLSLKAYYSVHPKQADGPLHGAIRAAAIMGITLDEYLDKTSKGLQRCSICKTWKPLDSFHRRKNKRYAWCKICRKTKSNEGKSAKSIE